MQTRLSICIYSTANNLTQSLLETLSRSEHNVQIVKTSQELFDQIQETSQDIDCLIVGDGNQSLPIFNQLFERGILLPVIMIQEEEVETESPTYFYHSAELKIHSYQIPQLNSLVDQAISKFLHLGSNQHSLEPIINNNYNGKGDDQPKFLLVQQRRLAQKLKERLGYLGVYYKRNTQHFYRNLSPKDKKELIQTLIEEYRAIALCYFVDDYQTNQLIDQFANQAFFTDISVSQILEIHMELMDEFAQQLKLEGRNEEILLDYRLVIIDIIAHLCEMYRRSIPREDFPTTELPLSPD